MRSARHKCVLKARPVAPPLQPTPQQNRRCPLDRRYNVQCAESWKQRIAKEQLHNAPVYLPGGDDDDDAASVLTVSSIRSSRTGNSVSTAMALEKIEALQKKLEEEQRRREAVEKELARLSELTKSASGKVGRSQ